MFCWQVQEAMAESKRRFQIAIIAMLIIAIFLAVLYFYGRDDGSDVVEVDTGEIADPGGEVDTGAAEEKLERDSDAEDEAEGGLAAIPEPKAEEPGLGGEGVEGAAVAADGAGSDRSGQPTTLGPVADETAEGMPVPDVGAGDKDTAPQSQADAGDSLTVTLEPLASDEVADGQPLPGEVEGRQGPDRPMVRGADPEESQLPDSTADLSTYSDQSQTELAQRLDPETTGPSIDARQPAERDETAEGMPVPDVGAGDKDTAPQSQADAGDSLTVTLEPLASDEVADGQPLPGEVEGRQGPDRPMVRGADPEESQLPDSTADLSTYSDQSQTELAQRLDPETTGPSIDARQPAVREETAEEGGATCPEAGISVDAAVRTDCPSGGQQLAKIDPSGDRLAATERTAAPDADSGDQAERVPQETRLEGQETGMKPTVPGIKADKEGLDQARAPGQAAAEDLLAKESRPETPEVAVGASAEAEGGQPTTLARLTVSRAEGRGAWAGRRRR